ncbi:MAG: hypothetical protein QXP53_01590 [Candidatus Pacearchaeota archaeon]
MGSEKSKIMKTDNVDLFLNWLLAGKKISNITEDQWDSLDKLKENYDRKPRALEFRSDNKILDNELSFGMANNLKIIGKELWDDLNLEKGVLSYRFFNHSSVDVFDLRAKVKYLEVNADAEVLELSCYKKQERKKKDVITLTYNRKK